MTIIKVTHWADVKGQSKRDQVFKWGDFCEWVKTRPPTAVKLDAPLIKLATFGELRTGKNSLRHDQNVAEVFGLEGDHDAESVTPEAAISMLEKAGIRAMVATSFSHAASTPRWRVFAPLSEAKTPKERRHLVARLNGALGGCLQAESFALSQAFFVGGRVDGEYLAYVTFDDTEEGACIDELCELDVLAQYPASKPKETQKVKSMGDPTYEEPANLDDIKSRLQAFLARNAPAKKRWEGSIEGLGDDTSGSTMDFSMVALLKIGGFDYSETVALMLGWPHGSTGPQRSGKRYWERIWEKTSDPEPDNGLPFASEYDLAETFAKKNENYFRWTPGLEWMFNQGSHWERDEALNRYSLAKQVCKEAAAELGDEKMRYRITTSSTTNAVLSLAKSEQGIVTPITAWDKEPMLLNTRGGVYDLATGKQVERGKHLFTQVTKVAPDPAMPTPNWDRFLSQVFSEDLATIDFIQRMAGYCMTGETSEQQLFFLHGSGSNGKNVFIDALHEVMGTYSHNLPSEALMRQRNEGHPTIYASLFGRRLAVSSEIEENAHWAESKIKELTGNDTLTARHMRQDFFTFKITHKHLLAGNYKPRLKGDDYAMVRRMVLIPFEQTFTGSRKDPLLPRKLRDEYPGILAWFIEGARKWATSGLHIPQKITDASKAYMADNDDLALWVDECCNVGPSLEGKSMELYTSFQQWKLASGEKPPSNKSFGQRLETKYQRARKNSGTVYQGLAVRAGSSHNSYAQASQGR